MYYVLPNFHVMIFIFEKSCPRSETYLFCGLPQSQKYKTFQSKIQVFGGCQHYFISKSSSLPDFSYPTSNVLISQFWAGQKDISLCHGDSICYWNTKLFVSTDHFKGRRISVKKSSGNTDFAHVFLKAMINLRHSYIFWKDFTILQDVF